MNPRHAGYRGTAWTVVVGAGHVGSRVVSNRPPPEEVVCAVAAPVKPRIRAIKLGN
jgi:hypothetical protein